jgi:transposase
MRPLVSDALWERLQPLLPPRPPRRFRFPGRKPLDDRKILTGILFVLKTGIETTRPMREGRRERVRAPDRGLVTPGVQPRIRAGTARTPGPAGRRAASHRPPRAGRRRATLRDLSSILPNSSRL